MTRHYASRQHGRHKHRTRRYHPRPRVSRGLWLVIALLIAGFAVFLLIVTKAPQSPEASIVSAPPPINSIKKPSPQKEKPKFEFYNILPQKQISSQRHTPKEEKAPATTVVIKSEAKKPAQAKAPAPVVEVSEPADVSAAPPAASAVAKPKPIPQAKSETSSETLKQPSTYWVQVGAFLIFDDADTLKAELAFMGFPASIQTATVNGKTWFRVRSGPFDSEAAAKKAQDQLKEADFSSKIVPS